MFIIKLGLTLRKLNSKIEKRQNLRTKIYKKYNVKGLHIAQFVENGLLNRYIGILIEDIDSISDFKNKILNIVNNIEKHVLFVKSDDNERMVIQSSISIISAHSPSIFIISGISFAATIVKKCESKILNLIGSNYQLEKISTKDMENLFFKRDIK